jgi:hypothetical protein
MIVGYARTSTVEQTAGLEAQQRDLAAAGVEKTFAASSSSSPWWSARWSEGTPGKSVLTGTSQMPCG